MTTKNKPKRERKLNMITKRPEVEVKSGSCGDEDELTAESCFFGFGGTGAGSITSEEITTDIYGWITTYQLLETYP